jgi:dienelactone hydrolase
MRRKRLWIGAAVAIACLGAFAGVEAAHGARLSLPRFPAIAPYCHRAEFISRGHRVRAALCRPAGSARMPAVVVLHGCGGFGGIDQLLARDLPLHGIASYYADYFGLTPPPGTRGFCGVHGGLEHAFATWQRVVIDATDTLKRMNGIDGARVGVVGWSLGGGLALVTAEYGAGTTPIRHSPYHALVVLSAFGASGKVGALPPTLVLSGGSGDAVPVADARALYRALRRAHVPAVLHVYPHGTHNWKGRQRIVGERWTFAFLQRYLVGG